MLPVAATCSWLLEPQRFFLTHGLFQSLTHGAIGHRQWWCRLADVADAGEARGWPGGGGLGPGPAQSATVSWPRTNQNQRRKCLALGRIMQITCLDPVFKNTQMLVYKSESYLGAICVPSLIQAVLSVNTGDQGFTVRLLSGSP